MPYARTDHGNAAWEVDMLPNELLAGNKDMHNIMDEFKFWPNRISNYGVSCLLASKKDLKTYNREMVTASLTGFNPPSIELLHAHLQYVCNIPAMH